MESNQPLDSDISAELYLSSTGRDNLLQTAGWAKFLAIIGFIFVGIMVIGGLSVMLFLGSESLLEESLPFSPAFLGGLYLLLAALYFFPVLYLFRFATHMQDALRINDQDQLDFALVNIRSHYKYIGIMVIVLLAFYALALVGIFVGGLAAAL